MSQPKLFAVRLERTVLVHAKDVRDAEDVALNHSDEILADYGVSAVTQGSLMSLEEFGGELHNNVCTTEIPYGGDGVTRADEILPAKLESADVEPVLEDYVVIFDWAASKKLTGSYLGWKGFRFETLGKDEFLISGGRAITLADGTLRPDFSNPQKVAITRHDIEQAEREYERVTGKCSRCQGRESSSSTQACRRCGGTGAASDKNETP